jgi:hypothetical protein
VSQSSEETATASKAAIDPNLPQDFEVQLLRLLCARLLKRLLDPEIDIPVAEMQLIRQLCTDNSVSFASIRQGDFGKVAQKAAEEFPFDEEGKVVPIGAKG